MACVVIRNFVSLHGLEELLDKDGLRLAPEQAAGQDARDARAQRTVNSISVPDPEAEVNGVRLRSGIIVENRARVGKT